MCVVVCKALCNIFFWGGEWVCCALMCGLGAHISFSEMQLLRSSQILFPHMNEHAAKMCLWIRLGHKRGIKN